MSEEWVTATLGEAADVLMGQSPPGESYNTSGIGLPFIQGSAEFGVDTPTPVKWCSQPAKVAEIGDLMVSVRAPVGDSNFADQRTAIGRGLAIVRGKPDALTGYLRLVVQNETANLVSASGSGMFSSITAANLRGFKVLLPPILVQRRIVDLMTHLDAHIANLQAERAALADDQRRLRESVMSQGQPRRAGDVFDIQIGRQRSPSRAEGPNMTRYLRAANVKDGQLHLTDVKEMDFDTAEQQRFSLQAGDVLVSEGSGSANAVGAAAQWNSQLKGVICIQNTLLRFRGVPLVTIPSFVNHWCRWAYESGAFRETASGTNILHIGSTRAVEMMVHWRDTEAQDRECKALDAYDVTLNSLAREIGSLNHVRRELLSVLLSGELNVEIAYDALLPKVA